MNKKNPHDYTCTCMYDPFLHLNPEITDEQKEINFKI